MNSQRSLRHRKCMTHWIRSMMLLCKVETKMMVIKLDRTHMLITLHRHVTCSWETSSSVKYCPATVHHILKFYQQHSILKWVLGSPQVQTRGTSPERGKPGKIRVLPIFTGDFLASSRPLIFHRRCVFMCFYELTQDSNSWCLLNYGERLTHYPTQARACPHLGEYSPCFHFAFEKERLFRRCFSWSLFVKRYLLCCPEVSWAHTIFFFVKSLLDPMVGHIVTWLVLSMMVAPCTGWTFALLVLTHKHSSLGQVALPVPLLRCSSPPFWTGHTLLWKTANFATTT